MAKNEAYANERAKAARVKRGFLSRFLRFRCTVDRVEKNSLWMSAKRKAKTKGNEYWEEEERKEERKREKKRKDGRRTIERKKKKTSVFSRVSCRT